MLTAVCKTTQTGIDKHEQNHGWMCLSVVLLNEHCSIFSQEHITTLRGQTRITADSVRRSRHHTDWFWYGPIFTVHLVVNWRPSTRKCIMGNAMHQYTYQLERKTYNTNWQINKHSQRWPKYQYEEVCKSIMFKNNFYFIQMLTNIFTGTWNYRENVM